jgi:capsular polysaccharide transport system permease protein
MVVHAPSLGTSFVVFYASGYLPFQLYATLQGHVQQALALLAPAAGLPLGLMDRCRRGALRPQHRHGSDVVVVALAGLALATGEVRIVAPGLVVLSLGACGPAGARPRRAELPARGAFPGMGSGLGHSLTAPVSRRGGHLRDGGFAPAHSGWLFLTPWIHITGLFRAGLYPGYEASYVSVPLVLAWALVPLAPVCCFCGSTATRSCRSREGRGLLRPVIGAAATGSWPRGRAVR